MAETKRTLIGRIASFIASLFKTTAATPAAFVVPASATVTAVAATETAAAVVANVEAGAGPEADAPAVIAAVAEVSSEVAVEVSDPAPVPCPALAAIMASDLTVAEVADDAAVELYGTIVEAAAPVAKAAQHHLAPRLAAVAKLNSRTSAKAGKSKTIAPASKAVPKPAVKAAKSKVAKAPVKQPTAQAWIQVRHDVSRTRQSATIIDFAKARASLKPQALRRAA